MNTKLAITVQSEKNLSEYKNHILVYDERAKVYTIASRAEFLRPQNEKISLLEKEINDLKKAQEDFTNSINGEFNKFLKTYQDSNKKLIDMVKASVLQEGEE